MGMAASKGDYGVDAPYVPVLLAGGGLILVVAGALASALPMAASGLFMFLSAASFMFTTRIGKLALWEELVAHLGLRGNERLLDLGCGRGAVLIMAARHLETGRAIGIDHWNRADQSGNSDRATLRNAQLEDVPDRIELCTADATQLPFEQEAFDVVVSSLALHNIKEPSGRGRALDEAVRVLRNGGQLVVVDIKATREYAARLRHLGMTDVTHRRLGWRGWYGGPWMACCVVTARKPA